MTRYGLDGCGLDENGTKSTRRWKVEKFLGDKVGTDGYFVASNAWMDEYTYVNRSLFARNLLTTKKGREQAAYGLRTNRTKWSIGALAE